MFKLRCLTVDCRNLCFWSFCSASSYHTYDTYYKNYSATNPSNNSTEKYFRTWLWLGTRINNWVEISLIIVAIWTVSKRAVIVHLVIVGHRCGTILRVIIGSGRWRWWWRKWITYGRIRKVTLFCRIAILQSRIKRGAYKGGTKVRGLSRYAILRRAESSGAKIAWW